MGGPGSGRRPGGGRGGSKTALGKAAAQQRKAWGKFKEAVAKKENISEARQTSKAAINKYYAAQAARASRTIRRGR